MSDITLGKVVEDLCENYGEDKPLNGALVIFWEADNGITASYLGTPLKPLGAIELALNGTRAMIQSVNNAEIQAEAEAKNTVRLVDE